MPRMTRVTKAAGVALSNYMRYYPIVSYLQSGLTVKIFMKTEKSIVYETYQQLSYTTLCIGRTKPFMAV